MRRDIPCYWETKPSGCQKPHCVFKHSAPRAIDVKAPLLPVQSNGVNLAPAKTLDTVVDQPLTTEGGKALKGDDVKKGDSPADVQVAAKTGDEPVTTELNNNNRGEGDSSIAAAVPAAAVEGQ